MTQLKRRVSALEGGRGQGRKCPLSEEQIDRKIGLLLKKRETGISKAEQAELDGLPKMPADFGERPMTEAERDARIEELLMKRSNG